MLVERINGRSTRSEPDGLRDGCLPGGKIGPVHREELRYVSPVTAAWGGAKPNATSIAKQGLLDLTPFIVLTRR
jgi:hypothetical protein